jgi:hypothetical protein
LIDADVVSHFITGEEAIMLNQIFPGNPISILDKVHGELQKWPSQKVRTEISLLLSKKIIRLMHFPEENEDIRKEYSYIKKTLFKGDGESACLAVARYNKNILASSNLKDIKHYCDMHKIDYLTTMDFLCEALRTELFNESRCNTFINKILAAKSKLPVQSMADHKCKEVAFL